MHSLLKFAIAKTLSRHPAIFLLFLLVLPCAATSQTRVVNASIDTLKTGAPISKHLYGQFLQHGGDIVNTGVWSEMLADRKFFYPVAASGPKPPPVMGNAAGNRRFNRTPTRWSAPIACDDFITMDTTTPYSGDQPAVNPGSDTYPLDVSAALSEDRKTLAIAVLNPSDSEQTIKIAIKGAKLASAGKLWRMAPDSIDATVQVDKKPEVQVEEQTLAALPKTITVRPFSVSIYSYPVQ